ncbi:hypothetical protein [Nonomuraea sp. NPDC049480]|uniref:hypothetical protein n=1 Tax=Nonomuraea sp. NPDC049480 TaxID=3364353 RepID=UPI00378A8B3B
MPSSRHEALHRIFRDNPGLFSHAFKILKIDFPASSEVAVIDTDLTEIKPIDRRCDTMMLFKTPWGSKQVVIIESQMQKDDGKVAAWAHYISYAHIKYECPVLLLVICQDETTARWAREPKRIGLPGRPCLVIYPIVLGPGNVPRITDPEEASKDVVLAMFSAVTHAHSPEVDAILEALDVALDTVDTDTANYIAEQTEIGLGAGPARQTWRRLMTMQNYRFKSEFAEMLRNEGRIEGEARGEAKSVLRILKRRGIHVTESARERILSCTDLALLETWLDQSFEVTTAEQLFD